MSTHTKNQAHQPRFAPFRCSVFTLEASKRLARRSHATVVTVVDIEARIFEQVTDVVSFATGSQQDTDNRAGGGPGNETEAGISPNFNAALDLAETKLQQPELGPLSRFSYTLMQ